MEVGNILAIVGSVVVPLLLFMLALRPFIKDTIRSELSDFRSQVSRELGDFRDRLARVEGGLEAWVPLTQGIAARLLNLPGNPNGRRRELLEKWRAGTLSYQESLELRDILAKEAEQAEEAQKNLIQLGLLALFLYALSQAVKGTRR